jgi:hypothetical protein
MPSINFNVSDTTVCAWTEAQCVGPCIPGFASADLAMAWESGESGVSGNSAF